MHPAQVIRLTRGTRQCEIFWAIRRSVCSAEPVFYFVKKKHRTQPSNIVAPLYRRDQYDELRRLSDDCATMPATWEEYRHLVSLQKEGCDKDGDRLVLAEVDLYDLIAYCASEHKRLDTRTRSQYALIKAATQDVEVGQCLLKLAIARMPQSELREEMEYARANLSQEAGRRPMQLSA